MNFQYPAKDSTSANSIPSSTLPVAVIGAGPVGLAAALHLLDQGLEPIILESGQIGESIRQWGHVRLFSPWSFDVDPLAVQHLEAQGWKHPDVDLHPTGNELVEHYLEPLAALPELAQRLRLHTRVEAISRLSLDKMKDHDERSSSPFLLALSRADGGEEHLVAQAVVDASGTWTRPNPLASNGLAALGEKRHKEQIRYGIPDVLGKEKSRYAGKRVLVVGSGHSAFNALLDLIELRRTAPSTEIVWAIRSSASSKIFVGGKNDQLAARGELGKSMQAQWQDGAFELVDEFHLRRVEQEAGRLRVIAANGEITNLDEIIVATGFRPDLDPLREIRLDLDPATESPRVLAPLIDPNIHSCGSVPPHGAEELKHPDEGFFIVGMKSYGRAPTFLLRTGYEQARSVAHAIAGDWEGARRVELVLPETGACKAPSPGGLLKSVGSACCG